MSRKAPEPQTPVEPGPPKYLVRWQCPDCGRHQSGWIPEFGRDMRICAGMPRNAPSRDQRGRQEPCDGVMQIVHDERPGRHAA